MFNAFMETVIPVATNVTNTVSMKEIEEGVPKVNDENDEQTEDGIDIKFDVSISGKHLRESLHKAFSFGRAASTVQKQRKRKR